ncbi:MAG: hypothetical protein LBS74_11145 [Oscillospiraceae bacterium]|jgi:hypothetical protein|nr:hypothetical protein [Oscillospiraceae bacterium]
MSNKQELLLKIKALAEQGIEGERKTAQQTLKKLMQKYEISENELETEKIETAWFAYSQEIERKLLSQIIYKITGEVASGCVGGSSNRKRKKLGIDCTAAQKLEIELNYSFYKQALQKELATFMLAFYQKNNIFPATPSNKAKETTDEELKAWNLAGIMSEAMQTHTLNKALAN